MAEKIGRYVYAIVPDESERTFGSIGIDEGEEVFTIPYNGVSAVVSCSSSDKYNFSRKNILAHENVVASVFKEYSAVLPVRFSTIANSCEAVREFLFKNGTELQNHLQALDCKGEIGLQVFWCNLQEIFLEIAEEEDKIKKLRDRVFGDTGAAAYDEKLQLGEMVLKALEKKKSRETRFILENLTNLFGEHRQNKNYVDEMVLNAVFLLNRDEEAAFEKSLADLDGLNADRYRFKRTGLLAPVNFVEVQVTA